MDRRGFLRGAALCAGALAGGARAGSAEEAGQAQRLRVLEHGLGRLGVYAIDTGSGQTFGHRADERFMLLSTFKCLAAACVLARVDRGEERLDRRIAFGRQDLLPWSPVTQQQVDAGGMTLGDLCAAAVASSDNAAGNLVLKTIGGPAGLTGFLRAWGDATTRLDRDEPTLNLPQAAEPLLDTTTPRAMAQTLRLLLLGEALSAPSRGQLVHWLRACQTGDKRLKAGLPAGWTLGDKTGTNRTDANDVGIVFPPGRAPIVVAAFLAGNGPARSADKEAVLAGVGRLLATF